MTAAIAPLAALEVVRPYLGDARLAERVRLRMLQPRLLAPEASPSDRSGARRPRTERVLEALGRGPKTAAEVASLLGDGVVDVRRTLDNMSASLVEGVAKAGGPVRVARLSGSGEIRWRRL